MTTETKMSAAMLVAAEKYKEGMDRFYVLLGLCSTNEQVDDALGMEKQVEADFLRAFWEETKAFNRLEDCMGGNARKIYKAVTGGGLCASRVR